MKSLITCSCLLICLFSASAQVTWNFTTATPTGGVQSNSSVGAVSQGNNNGTTTLLTSTSPSSGYAGASAGNNAGAAAVTGALSTATTAYFEVTITPAAGFSISVSNISLGSRSTATGPQLLTIRTSLDGFAADAGSIAAPASTTWGLVTPSLTTLTGGVDVPVTLRIYGSNGTGSPGANTANWRIDDLSITYVVSVLAVNLNSFLGNLGSNNTANLKWVSANETALLKYEIEKSTDAVTYKTIASINANGNTGGSYQFADVNVDRTVNFYRLKMINSNGTSRYSDVVRLNNTVSNGSTLTLYPSPATTKINTEFFVKEAQPLSLSIVDATGKVYVQQAIKASAGSNTISVPLDNLAKGVYTVIIKSANGIDLKNRFIKN